MDFHVGWPQGIWFGLVAFRLLFAVALDGEPRKGKHSLSQAMLGSGLGFGLLYWGGFFA